ncbi:hypothetical protein ACJJTC_016731 [Scirpophaga incertulas]
MAAAVFSDENDTSRLEAEESLLYSARHGELAVVKALLEAKVDNKLTLDINCKGKSKSNLGWTALHLATYFGHVGVVEALLEAGANVDEVNETGDTALHKASFIGNEELVILLLKHKADVHIMNGEGRTACDVCKTQDVQRLVEAAQKAERHERERKLLTAAKEGCVDVIQEALSSPNPPNINCVDAQGNTCLHCAAYRGHARLAVLLLQNGVDTTLRNNRGQLAIDLAKDNEMRDVLSVRPVQRFAANRCQVRGTSAETVPISRLATCLGGAAARGAAVLRAVLQRGVLLYYGSRAQSAGDGRCRGRHCVGYEGGSRPPRGGSGRLGAESAGRLQAVLQRGVLLYYGSRAQSAGDGRCRGRHCVGYEGGSRPPRGGSGRLGAESAGGCRRCCSAGCCCTTGRARRARGTGAAAGGTVWAMRGAAGRLVAAVLQRGVLLYYGSRAQSAGDGRCRGRHCVGYEGGSRPPRGGSGRLGAESAGGCRRCCSAGALYYGSRAQSAGDGRCRGRHCVGYEGGSRPPRGGSGRLGAESAGGCRRCCSAGCCCTTGRARRARGTGAAAGGTVWAMRGAAGRLVAAVLQRGVLLYYGSRAQSAGDGRCRGRHCVGYEGGSRPPRGGSGRLGAESAGGCRRCCSAGCCCTTGRARRARGTGAAAGGTVWAMRGAAGRLVAAVLQRGVLLYYGSRAQSAGDGRCRGRHCVGYEGGSRPPRGGSGRLGAESAGGCRRCCSAGVLLYYGSRAQSAGDGRCRGRHCVGYEGGSGRLVAAVLQRGVLLYYGSRAQSAGDGRCRGRHCVGYEGGSRPPRGGSGRLGAESAGGCRRCCSAGCCCTTRRARRARGTGAAAGGTVWAMRGAAAASWRGRLGAESAGGCRRCCSAGCCCTTGRARRARGDGRCRGRHCVGYEGGQRPPRGGSGRLGAESAGGCRRCCSAGCCCTTGRARRARGTGAAAGGTVWAMRGAAGRLVASAGDGRCRGRHCVGYEGGSRPPRGGSGRLGAESAGGCRRCCSAGCCCTTGRARRARGTGAAAGGTVWAMRGAAGRLVAAVLQRGVLLYYGSRAQSAGDGRCRGRHCVGYEGGSRPPRGGSGRLGAESAGGCRRVLQRGVLLYYGSRAQSAGDGRCRGRHCVGYEGGSGRLVAVVGG